MKKFNQITRERIMKVNTKLGEKRVEVYFINKIHFSCRVIHNFFAVAAFPPSCLSF